MFVPSNRQVDRIEFPSTNNLRIAFRFSTDIRRTIAKSLSNRRASARIAVGVSDLAKAGLLLTRQVFKHLPGFFVSENHFGTDISSSLNTCRYWHLRRIPATVSAMPKKTGRPPKDETGTKGERMELRVSEDEKSAMRKAAVNAGVSLSDWARAVLLKAAKRLDK